MLPGMTQEMQDAVDKELDIATNLEKMLDDGRLVYTADGFMLATTDKYETAFAKLHLDRPLIMPRHMGRTQARSYGCPAALLQNKGVHSTYYASIEAAKHGMKRMREMRDAMMNRIMGIKPWKDQ